MRRTAVVGAFLVGTALVGGCTSTVTGSAQPVTGVQVPTSGSSSSTTTAESTSRSASPTTTRTTTRPSPTTRSTSAVACSFTQSALGLATDAVNAYFEAFNADQPEAPSLRTTAVSTARDQGRAIQNFPYSDEAFKALAVPLGQAIENVGNVLETGGDDATVNAAADDVNTKAGPVKDRCTS